MAERTVARREPDVSVRAEAPRLRLRPSGFFARGEPFIWLLGAGVVLSLVMIVGLLGLIVWQGLATFWPRPIVRLELVTGEVVMGEVTRTDRFKPTPASLDELGAYAPEARERLTDTGGFARRRLVRTGNFELTGTHFQWVNDYAITSEDRPEWGVLLERTSWGRFYGVPTALVIDGEVATEQPGAVWERFGELHPTIRDRAAQRKSLEEFDIGAISRRMEEARLDLAEAKRRFEEGSERLERATADYERTMADLEAQFALLRAEIDELERENEHYALRMATAGGQTKDILLADIVRAVPANRLGFFDKIGVYIDRWVEFVSADPREANSAGGVYPAIFGTVVMTLLMSFAVVPFGVLAALYLREYAKGGLVVSTVKIAVNNLAGVPSIVFGVFGLGFFCYLVGGTIDEVFFQDRLPAPTFGTGGILWASLTLALLTLPVVIVATEEALAGVPNSMRQGSFACGATKWQTIRRIILPRAMPGIMTGMILAMARGAGEVAPLMLVGAVKLAPELPIDSVWPYIHPERSFMHLGFHIYDLGFQSQNSQAAKPLVYTTTLLLICIIGALNLGGIALRARLHRRFHTGQF